MQYEEIFARLRLLTGDDRDSLLWMLTHDALRMLQGRLRPDAALDGLEEALHAAAAAYGAYQLQLIDGATGEARMQAGTVQVTYDRELTKAKTYYEQCMAALSGVLQDTSLYLGGVRTWTED